MRKFFGLVGALAIMLAPNQVSAQTVFLEQEAPQEQFVTVQELTPAPAVVKQSVEEFPQIANPKYNFGARHNSVGAQVYCASSSSLEEASVVIQEFQVVVFSPETAVLEEQPSVRNFVSETHGASPDACVEFMRQKFFQDSFQRLQLIQKLKKS
jgi:hypothetical protein